MSSESYHDLANLSKDALIDIITRFQQNESQQQNENILARRNRLLTEENHNFRAEIDALNTFRMQYYNLKTSINHYNTNMTKLKNLNNALKQENILLNKRINETKQFETSFNEKDNLINQLKSQNQSFHQQIQQYQQCNFEITQLQKENKNLQEDLLREERLHCNKFETLSYSLTQYETKYSDLLQRYSSMERFVEEFCENANFSAADDNNENVVLELTKWTQILQYKQDNLINEINNTVHNKLVNIKHELNGNRCKMHIYKKEISQNICHNILNDIICSVIIDSNNTNINAKKEQLLSDERHINCTKQMMESQITKLNGQKQIICNLNKSIKDLYGKVKEYEHHIHRLTLQLKQLSLINKASQETNTDFNVQQIRSLSQTLTEKEMECHDLKNEMEVKQQLLTENENKFKEFDTLLQNKQFEYNKLYDKYKENKMELNEYNNAYNVLQKEYEMIKNKLRTLSTAYSDQETNNNLLKNKFTQFISEYNVLKQQEYNWKLREKELKEKYGNNYDKFNTLNINLKHKILHLENNNKCLEKESEEYHNVMNKYKQQSNDINVKYNKLKYQYEKLQNQQNAYNNTPDPKLQEYESRIKELVNQIKRYQQNNNNNNNNESFEIQIKRLQEEIESLQEQLYEGSNIRRELRAFITKYQREGQMKLNKNYKKLTFMKKLVLSTFRILNEQRQFIDKNDSLRQHLDHLRNTLQETQENNIPNLSDK